jgi:hypothetical protein
MQWTPGILLPEIKRMEREAERSSKTLYFDDGQ